MVRLAVGERARHRYASPGDQDEADGGGFGVKQAAGIGTEAQFDQRPCVRHHLGLPAVIVLEASHGGFRTLIPDAVGAPFEVVLPDQGCLNLAHPLRGDRLLATFPPVLAG